jgi:hypothetical protein
MRIVAVLFDGNPANRIEWLLRSDGIFEAWQTVDDRMSRVDNGKLATKEKNPKLGIAAWRQSLLHAEQGNRTRDHGPRSFLKLQGHALWVRFFGEHLGLNCRADSETVNGPGAISPGAHWKAQEGRHLE